ncbi:Opi1-domain-containing protein [Lentinus tigrinus ALCF2SS1-7]|uniref:Opi1-domain-containing protein n=1 Tax=Lentinus tigrinus ALCF2SS1-6 TaxID=1328759 RepID=A0A5C2SLJ7_9APHY|nr:Opi1-domain-containing protein [Lentinus tigrinus ALCF2SS1-6]RPD76692.1 Opi1-domain-containing protein [Lentinus tigrinus ALCF2SS1-7]
MALADEDESVRIAVRALGDMRNSTHNNSTSSPSTSFQTTPALSITSATSSPSLSSPSLMEEEDLREEDEERRQQLSSVDGDREAMAREREGDEWKSLSRVSNLPLVSGALRAYEHSKASSRVVKVRLRHPLLLYGAEMMESSMKSISRPVIDRLPVNQLDEFACRQLDRLGSYARRTSSRDRSRSESVDTPDPRRPWEDRDISMTRRDSSSSTSRTTEDDDARSRGLATSPTTSYASGPIESRTPTPHSTTSSQPERPTLPPASTLTQQADAQESQVAQRSRWQAVFLEAGGISAAISEESMRRLKYCLQWLQYATAQIDAQILVLRNFIVSLQPNGTSPNGAPISAQHLRTLQAAKRDVVDTVRQVVDVVSRYAGGALPEPARSRVRAFILHLPRRWAAASSNGIEGPHPATAQGHGHDARGESTATSSSSVRGRHRGVAPYSYGPGEAGPSPRSRPASRATSPVRGATRSHAHGRQGSSNATGGTPPTVDGATQAAQKILTLATESLDMLRSVTGVFKDSLDRADIWVERLRVVGLQRGQNGAADIDPENDPMLNFRGDNHLPPFPLPRAHDHRSHGHSPSSPLSPFAPLTPSTPGTAPHSGYSTPFYSLPRSSSTGSLSGLSHAFPGPLSMIPPYDAPSPAGGAAASLDKLSLSSSQSDSGSRFTTPKSALLGLPPEGDSGGGGGRGEKRRSESDESDAAVAAATALAGLAGSGGGLPAKRIKQEDREVRMDVDR